MYMYTYIQTQHTHTRTHTHVAISRASVTRREIYGFERGRSEDGRKQEMRRSNDRKPFSSDFQRFRRQQPPCQRCLELPLLRSNHVEKTAPLKRVRYLLQMREKNTNRVHMRRWILMVKNIHIFNCTLSSGEQVSLQYYRLSFANKFLLLDISSNQYPRISRDGNMSFYFTNVYFMLKRKWRDSLKIFVSNEI